MAQQIIGGVNGRPVLNYEGTEWIAMESPNPHAPGTSSVLSSSNAGIVSSASEITVTPVATPGSFSWYGDIFMVHVAGNTTLNFVFSWGTGVRRAAPQTGYAQGTAQRVIAGDTVGGSGGILSFTNLSPEVTTGSLAIPYYRYRLRVSLGGDAYYASSDAWVKLVITLS